MMHRQLRQQRRHRLFREWTDADRNCSRTEFHRIYHTELHHELREEIGILRKQFMRSCSLRTALQEQRKRYDHQLRDRGLPAWNIELRLREPYAYHADSGRRMNAAPPAHHHSARTERIRQDHHQRNHTLIALHYYRYGNEKDSLPHHPRTPVIHRIHDG